MIVLKFPSWIDFGVHVLLFGLGVGLARDVVEAVVKWAAGRFKR